MFSPLLTATGLERLIKDHTFVGVADLNGALSMLQHRTKLYLINHASLAYVVLDDRAVRRLLTWLHCSEELFYQLGLRQFGRFVRIKLQPAPPLRELIRLAVEHDEGRAAAQMPTADIIEVRVALGGCCLASLTCVFVDSASTTPSSISVPCSTSTFRSTSTTREASRACHSLYQDTHPT